ncbi:MAG: ATP synthase F1 subunit epsilon [Eubacteriales bacterium]
MDKRQVHLQVFTPRGLKMDERADMLIMRCVDGDMGVLPGHAPLSAALGDGILRIIRGEAEQKIALFGGVVVVRDNRVSILTTIAQRPDEIDLARAEADREQADLLLQEQSDELKMQSYRILLRRALVRIEVSVQPTGGGEDE